MVSSEAERVAWTAMRHSTTSTSIRQFVKGDEQSVETIMRPSSCEPAW